MIQNLLENENLFLRNKDERNTQHNVDVSNNKSGFPSNEIFIPYNKTSKLSQNIRNNSETNNIKLKNSFQVLSTPNDIEDTFNEVSDTAFYKTASEKVTVNTLAGQPEEKKKRETTLILGEKKISKVKRIQGRKLGRKAKQDAIVRSFPGAKLGYMSHFVIPTVKSNPDRIIIHCRTE